jgi:hypothetical protein
MRWASGCLATGLILLASVVIVPLALEVYGEFSGKMFSEQLQISHQN